MVGVGLVDVPRSGGRSRKLAAGVEPAVPPGAQRGIPRPAGVASAAGMAPHPLAASCLVVRADQGQIRAGSTANPIAVPVPGHQPVAPPASAQKVVSGAASNGVVAPAAAQTVTALGAPDQVVATLAFEQVAA